MDEFKQMVKGVNEEGRPLPEYIYENYRIKVERILQELDRNEAKRQQQKQEDRERPIREAERRREEEEARKQREQDEKNQQQIREEEAQYGTKGQRERRAAFNKSTGDLIDRYVKARGERKND